MSKSSEKLRRDAERENRPRLSAIWLIYTREMRDQLRDRRTLFTIAVLPILLYPIVGMLLLQIAQFTQQHPTTICVVGTENLINTPPLIDGDAFAEGLSGNAESLNVVHYRWDEISDHADVEPESSTWVREGAFDVPLTSTRAATAPRGKGRIRYWLIP